jgi:tetratricopeptide (TPR) repeat protein
MRMTPRRPIIAAVLICLSVAVPSGRAQSARELRDRAADLSYNLDHDEAITLLRQAIAAEPNDGRNHRALASTIWLQILFKRGAVTVDHYLGSFNQKTIDLKNPPAELDAEFKREVAKAIELADKQLSAAPKSAEAHFEVGTAVSLEATYMASVEGKVYAGFRAAQRGYDEAEKSLALDPNKKEAGLIVGTYRYIVSTLSFPLRWMAYMVGFGGDKNLGLKMVEETVSAGGENRTDAQFALVLLYNREKRYADAMRVLDSLRKRYPRNRLVVLEAGSTAVRAKQGAEAERLLTEGIGMLEKDSRPRIPGEDALWHYKRGAARVMLGRREEAQSDLKRAMRPDAAGWVVGRANLELGRLALQQGDKQGARRYAAEAAAVCGRSADPICVEEAKGIK